LFAAAVVPRAVASTPTSYTYSIPGNPAYLAVCNNGDEYGDCHIYPLGRVRTSGVDWRHYNEAGWSPYPYTRGRVIYTDSSGNWLAQATAPNASDGSVGLGPINQNAKAVCSNPFDTNATNYFACGTTRG